MGGSDEDYNAENYAAMNHRKQPYAERYTVHAAAAPPLPVSKRFGSSFVPLRCRRSLYEIAREQTMRPQGQRVITGRVVEPPRYLRAPGLRIDAVRGVAWWHHRLVR
jgi:hypothetical protein